MMVGLGGDAGRVNAPGMGKFRGKSKIFEKSLAAKGQFIVTLAR
jgi:hypothetical protein